MLNDILQNSFAFLGACAELTRTRFPSSEWISALRSKQSWIPNSVSNPLGVFAALLHILETLLVLKLFRFHMLTRIFVRVGAQRYAETVGILCCFTSTLKADLSKGAAQDWVEQ